MKLTAEPDALMTETWWSRARTVATRVAEVTLSAAQAVIQEQLAWQSAFAAGQAVPAGGTRDDLSTDYLCAKLSKRVYTANEWVPTETTAAPPPGMTWVDLDAPMCPVDRDEWQERRLREGLGRADGDICPVGADELSAVVVRDENPRCVLYKDERVGSVYVAFRGTLTSDDIRVILAHDLAPFVIPGRKEPLLAHAGIAHALDNVWAALSDAIVSHARGCRVVFTGHSLGGALALLAYARCMLSNTRMGMYACVTFGAPLVLAHAADAHAIDADQLAALRHARNFVLGCDIVPRLLGKGLSKSVVHMVQMD